MNRDRDINALIGRFRVASRELYNNHFRVDEPYKNNGWDAEERFSELINTFMSGSICGHRTPRPLGSKR